MLFNVLFSKKKYFLVLKLKAIISIYCYKISFVDHELNVKLFSVTFLMNFNAEKISQKS